MFSRRLHRRKCNSAKAKTWKSYTRFKLRNWVSNIIKCFNCKRHYYNEKIIKALSQRFARLRSAYSYSKVYSDSVYVHMRRVNSRTYLAWKVFAKIKKCRSTGVEIRQILDLFRLIGFLTSSRGLRPSIICCPQLRHSAIFHAQFKPRTPYTAVGTRSL